MNNLMINLPNNPIKLIIMNNYIDFLLRGEATLLKWLIKGWFYSYLLLLFPFHEMCLKTHVVLLIIKTTIFSLPNVFGKILKFLNIAIKYIKLIIQKWKFNHLESGFVCPIPINSLFYSLNYVLMRTRISIHGS